MLYIVQELGYIILPAPPPPFFLFLFFLLADAGGPPSVRISPFSAGLSAETFTSATPLVTASTPVESPSPSVASAEITKLTSGSPGTDE